MIEIDRQKIYESHGYKFKNFVCLTDAEKRMVLDWRNTDSVRKMMCSKEIIPLASHLAYIESLKTRTDCYYWLVYDPAGIEVGVLDLLHVDVEKDEGEIGYYLNPIEAGNGFEFLIECNYFVYSQLELGNNKVTINANNKEILLFYSYLGGIFEGTEKIGDEVFYVNKHATGDYMINNYDNFSLKDFARFVRNNRNRFIKKD